MLRQEAATRLPANDLARGAGLKLLYAVTREKTK
jgi:hypothetical protein